MQLEYTGGLREDPGFLQGIQLIRVAVLDAERTIAQDKDTSRYNIALSQTLDSLRASTAWIEVGPPNCHYLLF